MKKIFGFIKKHKFLLIAILLTLCFVLMTSHQRERFIIYFFCAGGALTLSQVGFWFLERKVHWVSRLLKGWLWFIIPGIAAIFAIGLREPLDVAASGDVIKSYLDTISWILGVVIFSWGRWRLHEREAMVYRQIKENRQ